jgi:hypothetical protein
MGFSAIVAPLASASTMPAKITAFAVGGQVTSVSSSSHTFTVRATVSGINVQKGSSYTLKTNSSTHYVTTKTTHGSFGNLKVGGLAAATGTVAQGAYTAIAVAVGTTNVSSLPRG